MAGGGEASPQARSWKRGIVGKEAQPGPSGAGEGRRAWAPCACECSVGWACPCEEEMMV